MEYKLGIGGRLRLLGILPTEGNLVTIRVVQELREALGFSEGEIADAKIQMDGDRVFWQEGAIPDKAIEVGAKGQEIVREALRTLDKEDKMTFDLLPLVDLFEYESD